MKLFIIALLLSGCAQTSKSNKDPIEGKKLNWILPDVEGHWELVDVQIVEEVPFLGLKPKEFDSERVATEESPWDSYTEHDRVFESDTHYALDYPIQAHRRSKFTIKNGFLHLQFEGKKHSMPIESSHDTLYIYNELYDGSGYFKEAFVRTTFNDSVLNVMKNHPINYPALAGTWVLEREYDYDYGTHYRLDFPHDLPDTTSFSREQMILALKGNKNHTLLTDSAALPYTFEYQYGHMNLTPGDWYDGDDSWIHFSPWSPGDPFNYLEVYEEEIEEEIEIPVWELDSNKIGRMTWDFNQLNQAILLEFPEAYEEFVSILYTKLDDHIEPSQATFLIPESKMAKLDSTELQLRLDRVLLRMGAPKSCAGFEIEETKEYAWSKWKEKRVVKIRLYFC